MIDEGEDIFPLNKGHEHVSSRPRTLQSFASNGRASPTGEIIFLETLSYSHGRVTSVEAYYRFQAKVAGVRYKTPVFGNGFPNRIENNEEDVFPISEGKARFGYDASVLADWMEFGEVTSDGELTFLEHINNRTSIEAVQRWEDAMEGRLDLHALIVQSGNWLFAGESSKPTRTLARMADTHPPGVKILWTGESIKPFTDQFESLGNGWYTANDATLAFVERLRNGS